MIEARNQKGGHQGTFAGSEAPRVPASQEKAPKRPGIEPRGPFGVAGNSHAPTRKKPGVNAADIASASLDASMRVCGPQGRAAPHSAFHREGRRHDRR